MTSPSHTPATGPALSLLKPIQCAISVARGFLQLCADYSFNWCPQILSTRQRGFLQPPRLLPSTTQILSTRKRGFIKSRRLVPSTQGTQIRSTATHGMIPSTHTDCFVQPTTQIRYTQRLTQLRTRGVLCPALQGQACQGPLLWESSLKQLHRS